MTPASDEPLETVGGWAKRYYLASRAAIDTILRPYDLGGTQWAVLWHLSLRGPSVQRDIGRALNIERATLSGVVSTLVRKGLVDQRSHTDDQRQRVLELTPAGRELWDALPDPYAVTNVIAFDGADADELATAIRVLQRATARLIDGVTPGPDSSGGRA